MASIRNQIVFITGASSGIGAACAKALAREGAKLILNARRRDRLETLSNQLLTQFSAESLVLPFDVSNLAEVKESIQQLPAEWRAVDVLINNAGLARGLTTLPEGQIEDWEEMIDVNVKGLLYVSRLIVPGMLKRRSGHVVNIASVAGIHTYPRGNVYCATKAAVRVLSEGLKMDLLGTPIRVTTISPGLVQTEFSEVRFKGDRERAAQVYAGLVPLTGSDVADAVLYCLTRPLHVNVAEIVLMPTDQASSTLIHRRPG